MWLDEPGDFAERVEAYRIKVPPAALARAEEVIACYFGGLTPQICAARLSLDDDDVRLVLLAHGIRVGSARCRGVDKTTM